MIWTRPLYSGPAAVDSLWFQCGSILEELRLLCSFSSSALYTVQFDEVYAKMLCFKGGNTPEYFYDRWHLSDPYDANSEWIPGEWPAIPSGAGHGIVLYEGFADMA